MEARPFLIKDHLPYLYEWLGVRRCYPPTLDEMPKTGFIVYDGETAICCAFLRLVEGGFGQLDGLTTNPEGDPAIRNQAIDIVVDTIIKAAKEMKLKSLTAFSADAHTLIRAQKRGFVKLPQTLIALDLTQERP